MPATIAYVRCAFRHRIISFVDDENGQPFDEIALALAALRSDELPASTPSKTAGPAFEATSGGVVRAVHAINALDNPDGAAALEYQDEQLVLMTRFTRTPNGNFVLLALAHNEADMRVVDTAYRLYTDDEASASDPVRVFAQFLERHCLDYQAGDRTVRFVPVVTAPASGFPDVPGVLGIDMADEGGAAINARVRRNADQTWTFAWPFVVDLDSYKTEVRSHQR